MIKRKKKSKKKSIHGNSIKLKDKEKKENNPLTNLPTQAKSSNKDRKIYEKEKNENNDNNLNLININLNNRKSYSIKSSNYFLDLYSFEEAIEKDYRTIFRIFYIYLLAKQPFFHAILYRCPLVHFSLRFLLLIFIISCDLALNAIFYFEDKISEKYKLARSLFLFAFSNNITVILLSTLIGFIFVILYIRINNFTNDIREVFRKVEENIKKCKKYVVTTQKKLELKREIDYIFKKYKIKIIIFVIIELLLTLFFWYYVTVFCQIYSSTQKSWLWDSFLSILSRIIFDLLLALGFAKFYRIGVESNVKCLYRISIFVYSYR